MSRATTADAQLALTAALTQRTKQLCLGLEHGEAEILELVTPVTAARSADVPGDPRDTGDCDIGGKGDSNAVGRRTGMEGTKECLIDRDVTTCAPRGAFKKSAFG